MNPWEEIQDKIDVAEVIADYIPVKQQGGYLKAVCPFHRDKNPSMVISVDKGLWHCFGCGAGGNMFGFVEQYENISKSEVLKKLAKKAGVELKPVESQKIEKVSEEGSVAVKKVEVSRKDLGYKYLTWSADIYHKVLLKILQDKNHQVSQYCISRGWTQELVETFKLGYAPARGFLLELIKKNKLHLGLFFEIGVLKVKTGVEVSPNTNLNFDQVADKFSDRLIVPINDAQNRVVGFTGRVLPYDKTERPKYLNSSESPWFHKSDLWYGWSLTQKEVRAKQEVILVEGNMDVIKAFQYGLKNVLASQGTSVTTSHLKRLKYLTKNLVLAFDNDEAGKTAGQKLYLAATKAGFRVYKLVIPEAFKDLDEWLTDLMNKGRVYDSTLFKSVDYLDFYLNSHQAFLSNSSWQVQKPLVMEFLSLLRNRDPLDIDHYITQLAHLTKKSVSALNQQFKSLPGGREYTAQTVEKPLEEVSEIDKMIYSNFLNYVAGVLSEVDFDLNKYDHTSRLEAYFELLSQSLSQLKQFSNLSQLVENKKQELVFIAANNSMDQEQIESAKNRIEQYLDAQAGSFLLDDGLKSIYLVMKYEG